jgi:2-aminomuconate deaminase
MQTDNSRIHSDKAPEPVGLYPHARRVGNLVFFSGLGPRERGTRKIPGVELDVDGNILSYDIEAQCHAVFKNLRLVAEEAVVRWEDVFDVTVFLTNMKDDFPVYNRVYAEYFRESMPARTTLGITSLPTPIAIEVKAIGMVNA